MTRQLFFCLILLLASSAATAQTGSNNADKKKQRKVELSGTVLDSFTKAALKARIELLNADSTFVDSTTCSVWKTSSYYHFSVPARQADFILKATCDGYEDTYLPYELRHISRNNFFTLPRILMKRRQDDDIYKNVGLDGLVVTGTKVKLTYRGDTLVYNAAAFNLPEGSMLDGLIRQMPGAELKDNGDIYINGRKVDYLTLNGKDFFKGKNKVMLDNLPYFTVKELKVYDKTTERSRLAGHDVERKDYVMDVQLKRQYNRGFMANAEVGAGTDHRYMGRLFSLYYDDHSRISLWGNTNNVNENRKPGSEGEWSPANMPVGLTATRQAGLNVSTEDNDKRVENNLDASLTWTDADQWTRTSTLTFADQGDILGGSDFRNRQKTFSFSASDVLTLNEPANFIVSLKTDYSSGRTHNGRRDSTYRDYLINQSDNLSMSHMRTLNLNANAVWFKKFYWGDYLMIDIGSSLSRQKPSDSFSRSNTRYASGIGDDRRDYYSDTHQDGHEVNGEVSYTFQMPDKWFITPSVAYTQAHSDVFNSTYRLDFLGNLTPDDHNLGWLPSTREALQQAFDYDNSDEQHHTQRTLKTQLSVSKSSDTYLLMFSMPVAFHHDRMHFINVDYDTIPTRRYLTFQPSVNYYRWNIKRGLKGLSYHVSVTQPDFASLIPGDATTNPLAKMVNNPDLKARIDHNASAGFTFRNDSLKRNINIWASTRLSQHAWGTKTEYDAATGAYTYTNDNIEGNWYAQLGASFNQPIDRKKRLTLKQTAYADYTHSVDFPVMMQSATNMKDKSTVNNVTMHEKLELEYQKATLTAAVSGEFRWRHATSDRTGFTTINAYDFNYGARLLYTIPWLKLNLATDLRQYSTRGYGSELMNTDNLVWNAELSRTLLKKRLTLKLTAFDLLHQLKSTQYQVNAQGRTETWQNSLPRYVMLSIAYKII